MAINASKFIWHNGRLIPWEKATVHVLSHALHYGSSVFEGLRVYRTSQGPCFFRLGDHTQRLFNSAKLYRMEIPFSQDELNEACHNVVGSNGLHEGAYVRPIAFYGYGGLGVLPDDETPVEVSVAAFEWGTYLGTEALKNGVDVCVSSWQRVAPNTIPTGAKAGGNYLSSILIGLEANRLGFAEGIGLTPQGLVSEGAGENVFAFKEGVLYTPSAAASILSGITRDTAIKLAQEAGIEVREQSMPREMLYLADELFFTGTAAEITPIRSVDGITVADGRRGPLTERLQNDFFGLFTGASEDKWGWLSPVQMELTTPHAVPSAR